MPASTTQSAASEHPQVLRLLSYNIQVAIGTTRYRHYLTHSWKHVLPHAQIYDNLDRIGHIIANYDVVALQEVDAGSIRSSFINQTQYLAEKAGFPHWYQQVNRDLGRFAQHSNGLVSHIKPREIVDHKLPGFIPGRGAMCAHFGANGKDLVLVIIHLALGKKARQGQISTISDIIKHHKHVVVMGDMNCSPGSKEMDYLLSRTHLCEPTHGLKTFPSWRPKKTIDHILVTPGLEVSDIHVLNYPFSDHLPIAMDIIVPKDVSLEHHFGHPLASLP